MKTAIESMKVALEQFDRLRRLGMEPSIGNSTGNTIANSAYMTLESAIKLEESKIVEPVYLEWDGAGEGWYQVDENRFNNIESTERWKLFAHHSQLQK